jgi:hypothetical protein
MNDRSKEAAYEQPEVTESFVDTEILGDAPEASGTHLAGSHIYLHAV